jgi:hypothetical protein
MTLPVTRPMLHSPTRVLLLGLLATVTTIGGCGYTPGGPGYSRDAHTYVSTTHEPKSITLLDTRTGETLWRYEIPVDRKLTVRFYKQRNAENAAMPDEMRWEEWGLDRSYGSLENKLPVPPAGYRRMEMTIRKPELATSASPDAGG